MPTLRDDSDFTKRDAALTSKDEPCPQDREPVEVLAEEFAVQLRAGKNPSIVEYADRYPDHAARIKELFPYVAMMEQFHQESDDLLEKESEEDDAGVAVTADSLPRQPTLGDYVLLSKIGGGGMGRVFKARHRRMDRLVALKVLPAAVMKESKAVKRFHREMKAAAKLFHPNVVTAFDAGEQDGVHYLVMEYVDGQVLSRIVKEHGALPPEKAAGYTIQVARGLEYAHSREVIHRDVKPSNLICAEDGSVKVVDFGLARFSSAAELTQSGTILGTVFYMSPEQISDPSGVDLRSDVYSLGCTLYFLLTGQPPFTGTINEAIRAHQQQPPPRLSDRCPGVPARLDEIVSKLLSKRPADRYQSMGELIADLEKFDEVEASARSPNRVDDEAGTRRTPAVGVDVGTVFSMIARIDSSGQPKTIVDRDNESKMPSVVSINGLNINVGTDAFSGIGIPPENLAHDIKRSLGKSTYPSTLNGGQYPPEVLFGLLLAQLANRGRRKIGELSQVAVAVPNSFSEIRRKSVMDAAYLAGLKTIGLVNETVAAALFHQHHYVRSQAANPLPRDVLVLKLGASDFAVSLVRCGKDAVTSLATECHPSLGGQDFDVRLIESVRKRMSKELGVHLAQDRGTNWLLGQKCETAKQTLSTTNKAVIRLDFRGRSIPIEISREMFSAATSDLCEVIQGGIQKVLEKAGIACGSVERILLVGGATRMALVPELIKALAGADKPIEHLSEDAVVQGAALYAKIELEKRQGGSAAIRVSDVSTQDVGVRVNDRRSAKTFTSVLIPRNTPLPVTYKSAFTTTKEGQPSATLRIMQSRDAAEAPFESVGSCAIDDLDTAAPSRTRISVEFQISESGRLSVHVESPATRRRATKEITYATGLSNVELNQWREWVDTMMLCSGLF